MKNALLIFVIANVGSVAWAATNPEPSVAPQTSATTSSQVGAIQTALPKKKKKKSVDPTFHSANAAKAPQTPTSTIKDRTQLDPSPSAATTDYQNALAKRRPKKSLTTDVPSEPGIKPPQFGDWQLKAQLRNDMMLPTVQELQNVGGQNFDLNNEVRLGLKHKSGWGFSLTAAYDTMNYADPSKDVGVTNDASLILFHPSIFKNNTFDLYGYLRLYVPTSESSRENDGRSVAYWSFLDITLAKRFSISQTFSARMYTQSNETDTSKISQIYDAVELAHSTFKGVNLSFGVQGIENVYNTQASANEVDVYPFIDFTFIPNILIEPKYYFPVYVGGSKSVGSTGAAMDQSSAELFIKMAI